MLETIVKLLQEILVALSRLQVPAVPNPTTATETEVKNVVAATATAAFAQEAKINDPFASGAQSAVVDRIVKAAFAEANAPAAPTREDVGKALIELATAKDRDAAVAALASVGAVKLKDVTADKYPVILAAIKKLS